MTVSMFDTIQNSQFPAGAAAYAGYVDGGIGDQPNYAYVVSTFPGAHHLSVALFAGHDADCLDVEAGAASPSDIPGWHARQVRRGIARPVVYASAYAMDNGVLPVLSSAGIARASVRLWSAHYDGEHVCGPGSCKALRTGADGTQWTSAAMGRVLDQSLLAGDFFGPPANWTFGTVRGLKVAKAGPHSVALSWSSPGAPAPEAVHHYQVTIRRGGKDAPGFPVTVPKGANPEAHQFNGLVPGTAYEALVRAADKDGKRASPWAAAGFSTPS